MRNNDTDDFSGLSADNDHSVNAPMGIGNFGVGSGSTTQPITMASDQVGKVEGGLANFANSMLSTPTANLASRLPSVIGDAYAPAGQQDIDPVTGTKAPTIAETKKSLQAVIQKMPTDDKTWASMGATSLVGSLFDPLTFDGASLAEDGLKMALPKAMNWLEPEAVDSLSTRMLKSAIKGTTLGTAGGLAGSTVDAIADPHHTTLEQYLANTASWGAMGLAGGLIKPVAADVFKGLNDQLFPKTEAEQNVDVKNTPPVSRETLDAQDNIILQQANAGKKADVEAVSQANVNNIVNDIQDKEVIHSQSTGVDNLKSPSEQINDVVSQAKENVADANNNISGILDALDNEHDQDSLRANAFGTPLPRLWESITKIDNIDGLNDENKSRLDNLKSALQDATYNFGPSKVVREAINAPRPYLVYPDDRQLVSDLHDPQTEIDKINNMNADSLSDKNISIINARKESLEAYQNNSLYTDHLPNLNDALDNLADKQLDLSKAQSMQTIASHDPVNITDAVTNLGNGAIDDNNYITSSSNQPSIEDLGKENQPNEVPQTIDELDRQIGDLKSQGHIDDDDVVMHELRAVDAQEKLDNHQNKLFSHVYNCLMENGL